MIKKYLVPSVLAAGIFLPLLAPVAVLADYVPLALSPTTTVNPLPLLCYDFKGNLKPGSSGDQVRRLQFFLLDSGYSIGPSEYGVYEENTYGAVKAFQEKYKDDILTPNGLKEGSGIVGRSTRAKLNSLYGCAALNSEFPLQGGNVSLQVSSVSLDSNGISATFCNKKGTVPSFPVRLRLNGVIRDFDILGARNGGICETDTFPYGAWGLTFDPGVTFSLVTVLDPLALYKKGTLQYPGGSGTQLTVPAITGAHLAVRSLLLTSTGIQATFCNQGTADLDSFPIRITSNGVSKDFDVAEVHMKGICKPKQFGWNVLGVNYTAGTQYSVTVVVDPNNVISEVNEFDNAASVVGTP